MVSIADRTRRMQQWVWSDEKFCERVVEQCKKLGKSQRSVLKEANCAHDYLQTNPAHGRRIDRISRIADVLELDVGAILGLPVMNGQIDVDLLMIAYQVAKEAMQGLQSPDDGLFVHAQASVYNHLIERQAAGDDVRATQFVQSLIQAWRSMVTTRRPS